MFELLEDTLRARGVEIIEVLELPPQSERRSRLPPYIRFGPARHAAATLSKDGYVWSHQAEGLEHLGKGENVVIATGTASGKSLIFQVSALHLILSDDGPRTLVFYPQKALAADQHARWLKMAADAGLPSSAVARIDGDMNVGERLEALKNARLVLMTPDVCQAWFMRNVASAPMRRFLQDLALLVLDEAHVYESVFGSNVSFLLRRLIAAKHRVSRAGPPLQVLAATATIAFPHQHLCELTGLEFTVIDDRQNGAPTQTRRIYHINSPEGGESGESALADLLEGIVSIPPTARGRFIAFHDSRQGIERVVRAFEQNSVLPYRSGYEASDRQAIERALRSGHLDGVISTSALELGIDIADMTVGVNLGVPQSRKSFRQRLGRVGRAKPGAFLVLASHNAFRRYGETFKSYYDSSVEPSYLYLGNRFVQFAHARCFVDEAEVMGGDKSKLPGEISWPDGFAAAVKHASPGGARPREFDFIAQLGADNPHYNYPLRQIGEASLDIKFQRDASAKLGSIAMNQAIREAYPGATYLHMGRAYKVAEWQTRAHERAIRVFPAEKGGAPTKPILRTAINLSLDPDSIVDGHALQCPTGLVAEVHLQVTESVEGYRIGGNAQLYKDLRSENPSMSRKQRDFRTTGVVLQIQDKWFAGGGAEASLVRKAVAEGLKDLLARERSIAPQDIDATHTNIAVIGETGPRRVTDSIVVYDAVYGGLRLTEDLFLEIRRYVQQLVRAAEMAGDDALVPTAIAERLYQWSDCLEEAGSEPVCQRGVPDGWHQIYKPGSQVGLYINNALVSVEVGMPQFFTIGEASMLMYVYHRNGATQMVPHAQLQPVGQDWQWALWHPETGEIKEIDDPASPSPEDSDAREPSSTQPRGGMATLKRRRT